MSKAVEIINAVMSPANKLVDAVSGAIGKLYEPTHIKRLAKARAYEIETVGNALRENADIPIEYNKGEISADITEFDDFVKRTQSRMAFQELRKQENIESVANQAYRLLENETECSNEPVSQDWMIRFFNSVEDISEKDMQTLWAKILVGEVKRPKSFSLRTLDALKNLSAEEALIFQKITSYVFSDGKSRFIADKSILYKHGITLNDILTLEECGLLTEKDSIYISRDKENNEKFERLYNREYAIEISGDGDCSLGIILLTRPGQELSKVLSGNYAQDYMTDIANAIFLDRTGELNVRLYKCSIDNNEIKPEGQPLLNLKG